MPHKLISQGEGGLKPAKAVVEDHLEALAEPERGTHTLSPSNGTEALGCMVTERDEGVLH
jgi:hypothetical protein